MKSFESLTRLGRIRRARKIILLALKEYDIQVKQLSFLTEDTNIFFKIIDVNNKKYAVKLYQELSSDMNDSLVEMYLIRQIACMTDINVPGVFTNIHGDDITLVNSEYATCTKRVSLYEWLEGTDLDEKETPQLMEQLGEMVAKMHLAMSEVSLPKHLNPKRYDKVLYYAGDELFYKCEKYQTHLSPEYTQFMDFAINYFDEQLKNIYSLQKPILLHGDLNPYNIKINKNKLSILDFEDAIYAMPLHDLAIILFYYQYEDQYEIFKDAILRGYQKHRSLEGITEEHLRMVLEARRVNFLNYILEVSDTPKDYIDKHMPKVMKYFKEIGLDYTINQR